jgi:hypothetical protein
MPIDRRSVVERHDVILTGPDAQAPLTVGNGDFACTVDITGMQTFREFHDPTLAGQGGQLVTNTCTQSTWGWHEMPSSRDYKLEDALSTYKSPRGDIEYADRFNMMAMFSGQPDPETEAGNWLHTNPQRLDLGRVGLVLMAHHNGERERDPLVLTDMYQWLSLWSGTINSSFRYAGQSVSVLTAVDPRVATVAYRIDSPLLASGLLEIEFAFPYASDGFMKTADWDSNDRHTTTVAGREDGARILRTLDATTYAVDVAWDSATLQRTTEAHRVRLAAHGEHLDLVVSYSNGSDSTPLPSVDSIFTDAAAWWEAFWQSGAAIDFSGSTDPRAQELERRIVLSQYLTMVNSAGTMPPQETGLVVNSWQGKSHLEMHWWHAAHFAMWGRPELLAKSLDWYRSILPAAKETARRQGYDGARWPKQVGPDGRESPSEIGSFLIWQQPHLLYFAELLYRRDPSTEVISGLAELVDQTARFMASFVEERGGEYHLSPPLIPAQECYDMKTTEDPTFELAYWWWGLEVAQQWRERQGLSRTPGWTAIQDRLAKPHQSEGLYTATATAPFIQRIDHPSLLGALGFVPQTPLIEDEIMRATLVDVTDRWEWAAAWGWDFPTLAMTATRLEDPEAAIDALLMPQLKNHYLVNGHNPQGFLPLYLPGNGGLLAAVSLMIGGWDGAARPGIPDDGRWEIEFEGFIPWP